MAGTREGKIIKIATMLFGSFVKEVLILKDDKGHPVMRLIYKHGHEVHILQTFPLDRIMANKWPEQIYFVNIIAPEAGMGVQSKFLTAKMVKMAILKTKKLDMLKGVKLWA
ncbi:MAG: hypothetical protein JRJ39_00490 [Deltaproteobacteria bacterium]|nr:hypothetical protein [Deltaproteobacteria bacterium]MBW1845587.1 hypothetical protein [Deltaproteobacteria bacterium]MBW2032015.1 hypothetical protein [Deltaproteobacteria bacterium]